MKWKPFVPVEFSVTFWRNEEGWKCTFIIVHCGRLEVQFYAFLWTDLIWLMDLSVLENIWGILPCSLCFKHQGKLVWSHLKEPLSQKLPYHSNYASTRQTAGCSAMHVKMGLFIEPFANSDMLYCNKSKHKEPYWFSWKKKHINIISVKIHTGIKQIIDLDSIQTKIQEKSKRHFCCDIRSVDNLYSVEHIFSRNTYCLIPRVVPVHVFKVISWMCLDNQIQHLHCHLIASN